MALDDNEVPQSPPKVIVAGAKEEEDTQKEDNAVASRQRSDSTDQTVNGELDEAAACPDTNSKSVPGSSRIHNLLTPKNVRWDPSNPPPFTLSLAILYATASAFTVANLYYNQPILNRIAHDFGITYEQSSHVPTLLQSGYAAGLIFLLPLGDMLKRRPFIISLVFFTATVWIGLCVTRDFAVFQALSFICGITTVVPQLMIPLVGDFAPAERKAKTLSVVVTGLMLGLLVARLLSGIVANFTSWRNVYWIACGIQYGVGALLFFFMPDYPSTNPDGLNYFHALWTIVYMLFTEPVLIQACLIVFTASCIFTSYWTTSTFLLASPPYEYSTIVIGLFALLGIASVLVVTAYARVIDRFVPLFSLLVSQSIALASIAISVGIGTFTVAGPIIQAIGIDIGLQISQIANRTSIFEINPKARNRVNTAYMALAFSGQLTGTAVGNRLYAQGGWRYSSGASIGFVGLGILITLARGPREKGWIGWTGGWNPRVQKPAAVAEDAEVDAAEQGTLQVIVDTNKAVNTDEKKIPS